MHRPPRPCTRLHQAFPALEEHMKIGCRPLPAHEHRHPRPAIELFAVPVKKTVYTGLAKRTNPRLFVCIGPCDRKSRGTAITGPPSLPSAHSLLAAPTPPSSRARRPPNLGAQRGWPTPYRVTRSCNPCYARV